MLEAQQSLDRSRVAVSDRRGRRGSTVGELGGCGAAAGAAGAGVPGRDHGRAGRRAARWSRLRPTTTASRPATPASRDGPSAGRGPAPADRDRGRDQGRDAPTRPGRRRADRPQQRAPVALEQAVLDAFTTQTACRRKLNRPPGDGALAELAKLHGHAGPGRAGRVADRLRPARGGGVLMSADTIYQQLRAISPT